MVTQYELTAIRTLPAESEGLSLQSYATAVQISLWGYIACGFFLSRTYFMLLYLLVGMAVAIATMAKHAGDFRSELSFMAFSKQTVAWCCASIMFIYIFVRMNAIFPS